MFSALLLATSLILAPPPNVVLVVADDLGYGELGSYGQTKIRTPRIDALAREGLRFTSFYAGAPVCAPSRCALMTGLHTGHAWIRANREVQPEGQEPLPAGAVTVASMLRAAGYGTGAFGKWGLGGPGSSGSPVRQGFDVFFGYLCQRHAHRYYPDYLRRNDERVEIAANRGGKRGAYAHDLVTEEALAFLRAQDGNRPFFLYIPYTIPHVDLDVPDDSLAEYAGAFPETPYDGSKGYRTHSTPRAAYAAMVTRMDRDVGRIVKVLDEKKLAESTLVLFTSDNGPTYAGGADSEFFESTGGLRGLKGSVYEGGIRVPLVARWKGKIEPGTTTSHVAAFWDVYPTLAEVAGAKAPEGLDGISFAPTLLGRAKEQRAHEHLLWEFHEGGGQQAVRLGDLKGVRQQVSKRPDGPIELYDLAADPAESRDVALEHPEVVARMAEILKRDRSESPIFRF